MKKQSKKWGQAAAWAASFAIVNMALSISITQISIALSFLFWLFHKLLGFQSVNHKKEAGEPRLPAVFLCAFLLFGAVLVSEILHSFLSSPSVSLRSAFQQFFGQSDLYLMFFGILLWSICKEKSKRQVIEKGFIILIVLLIVSGIFSAFSETQLSTLIMNRDAAYNKDNPPQYWLFSVFGIPVYSPSGFMSTRLTYAGMLILVLPYLLGKTARSFAPAAGIQKKTWYRSALPYGNGFLFILGMGVLWLTGVRSAIIGLAVSLPVLLWSLKGSSLFARFLQAGQIRIRKFLYKKTAEKTLRKTAAAFCFICLFGFIGLLGLGFYFNFHMRLLKPVMRIGDFGRPLMWTESGDMIAKSPFIGVGQKNYSSTSKKWRSNFLKENPDTWYAMHFIPTGHAHNDILDISCNNGLPAAFFFLGMLFLILRGMLDPRYLLHKNTKKESVFLLCGCLALFIGGLFQCYFKDDEVVVIFWLVLALGLSKKNTANTVLELSKKEKQY